MGQSSTRASADSHVLPALCRFILLEADTEATEWSKLCLAQADCILLVAAGRSRPEVRSKFSKNRHQGDGFQLRAMTLCHAVILQRLFQEAYGKYSPTRGSSWRLGVLQIISDMREAAKRQKERCAGGRGCCYALPLSTSCPDACPR